MSRLLLSMFFIVMLAFSFNLYARQSGGGEDLAGVCELAGGRWTGNENGNWACCWPDWGCYGCHSGICKMQCRTQRCRDANNMRNTTGTKPVKGLAGPGMKAPIAPIKRKKN